MDQEKKKKVLIVEDDEFLQSLGAKRLETEGYEVFMAQDGQKAIESIPEVLPNLIFLDLLLPIKNGFEVLESIKNDPRTKDIPVIVFSNLGQQEDVDRAKSLGAQDFLIKANFTLDDVVTKIKSILQ